MKKIVLLLILVLGLSACGKNASVSIHRNFDEKKQVITKNVTYDFSDVKELKNGFKLKMVYFEDGLISEVFPLLESTKDAKITLLYEKDANNQETIYSEIDGKRTLVDIANLPKTEKGSYKISGVPTEHLKLKNNEEYVLAALEINESSEDIEMGRIPLDSLKDLEETYILVVTTN